MRFEGYYFKQQNGGKTISFIPGRSESEAFIQVITDDASYNIPYALEEYSLQQGMTVGDSSFSAQGISVHIDDERLRLEGSLQFAGQTPISGDIMGPFRFFPMECRHQVVSMNHSLCGRLTINGQVYDMDGGRGYIEGDSGKSFPSSYTWVQCNSWPQRDDCSVMASVARIPFAGLRFWGCIAVVWHQGREYRLATYKGVRIVSRTPQGIVLRQRDIQLAIDVSEHMGHALKAPQMGDMRRIIHECPSVPARFTFRVGGEVLFDRCSDGASYEYVY